VVSTQRAWRVRRQGPLRHGSLVEVREAPPRAAAGELVVAVLTSAVCRTDLHVTQGDLPVRKPGVTPGHQVVGEVAEVGPGVTGVAAGDRVGVGWVRSTCGACRFCARADENLCPHATFTGWHADGGYAETMTVPADAVHRLPTGYPDTQLAPLLCAGISGYRTIRMTGVRPGGALGIYGFGSSAHLAAQFAMSQGITVHVITRNHAARDLALALGAASAAGPDTPPPEPLDGAAIFAPVGTLVPVALDALDRGGTVALASIHLTDVPALDYERHVFYERRIQSVTANTRQDAREFLEFSGRHRLHVSVTPYSLGLADRALMDLDGGRVTAAAVLTA
jgi:propanol-preferring alcohol dehydrogenase